MKNKHHLQRLIGGIIFLVGIVAGALGLLVFKTDIVLYIGIGLLIVGVFWYFVATTLSRKVCDVCGGKMKGCEYGYQEVDRRFGTDPANPTMTVRVDIWASCPNCGARKQFKKSFTCKPGQNPQYLVDDFCRSIFGH